MRRALAVGTVAFDEDPLDLRARKTVHERGEASDRAQVRLGVHRAYLDGAQPWMRADVPPQERVVVELAGGGHALDRLDVVLVGGECARDLRARVPAEEDRPRGGQTG